MTFVPLLEGMETNKAFLGKKALALNNINLKFIQFMIKTQEPKDLRQFVVSLKLR